MNGCPGCGHASHTGRCPVFYRQAWSGYCRCSEREEIPDGLDSPASGDSHGAAVPVAEPGRERVTTIHDVDRAMEALVDACERYKATQSEEPLNMNMIRRAYAGLSEEWWS